MPDGKWNGVPLAADAAWREIFNAAAPAEQAHLSAPCPICGNKTLRRFYSLMKVKPREIEGEIYVGPGSYWEWCSSCRAFEHFSGLVPAWWDFDLPNLDHYYLKHDPGLIDDAMHRVGQEAEVPPGTMP